MLTPSYADVAARKKSSAQWPFGRKFALWLEDNGLSLNAFAIRQGFVQSTLQG